MEDPGNSPGNPFVPRTADPYENQVSQWGIKKIREGADATTVNSLVSDKVHAYRASLANRPDTLGPETTGDRAAGALSSAYQGMTLGAGNKITAGIRTVLPEAIGGTKGFDFPEAMREQTGVLHDYQERHPIASAGMEFAGSLPTIMATAGESGAAPAGRLAQAFRLGKQGAAYGAASGALSANDLGDVIPGALKGGAMGAVAGPVAGAAGGMIARGASRVARKLLPTNTVAKTIGDAVGVGPVTPDEQASGMLRGALQTGHVEPSEAAASLAVDQPTSMLDLGSQGVQKLARQARNVPTSSAGQTIDRFLSERQAGTGHRIQGALQDATGHTATDIHQPVEELIAQRSAEAKPLYEAANAHGEIQNPETIAQINTLRQNPVFAKAWKRGQSLDALENPSPAASVPGISPERMAELKAQGLDKFLPTSMTADAQTGPTVSQINAWKKGLDAQIEAGAGSKNALSRSEARAYRQKLRDVLDLVDQEVPAFAKARDHFRGMSELKDAAEAGGQHFSNANGVTSDYLQRTLPEQYPTQGEQHAYQANALNAFVAKVRGLAANPDLPEAARGTNIVQRLMGSEDAGKRLRMLFPDQASYDSFLAKMEQEAKYPATNKFLTQQSSTAGQLAESGVSPGTWRDAGQAAMGSTFAKARLAMKAVQAVTGGGKMSPDLADAIGRQSTLTGPKLQDALRKMMSDQSTSVFARQRIAKYLTAATAANAGNSTP